MPGLASNCISSASVFQGTGMTSKCYHIHLCLTAFLASLSLVSSVSTSTAAPDTLFLKSLIQTLNHKRYDSGWSVPLQNRAEHIVRNTTWENWVYCRWQLKLHMLGPPAEAGGGMRIRISNASWSSQLIDSSSWYSSPRKPNVKPQCSVPGSASLAPSLILSLALSRFLFLFLVWVHSWPLGLVFCLWFLTL